MTAPERVRPGTVEQLARLAHFASLDLPQVEELDAVALSLIGDVGGYRDELWQQLKEGDAQRLWHLITDDWDDRDCDEIPEVDWTRHSFATQQQEIDHRYEITRARLVGLIENTVWLARVVEAEARRPRTAVAS